MSKYDDEREKILNRMKANNISFTPSMSTSSKYDDERTSTQTTGSKYDQERTDMTKYNVNNMRAGSAQARVVAEENQRIFKQKESEQNKKAFEDAGLGFGGSKFMQSQDKIKQAGVNASRFVEDQKQAEKATVDDYLQRGRNIRDAQDPKNPFLKFIKDNTVDTLGRTIDRFSVGETGIKPLDKIGLATNRFSQSGVASTGVDPQAAGAAPFLSTGSKFVDKTADISGAIGGFLSNPAKVPSGMITAPYNAAATQTISGAIGSKLANPLSRLTGGKLSPGAASRITTEVAKEGLVGLPLGPAQLLMQGESDPRKLAWSAVESAGLGGLTGGLLRGGAEGVGALRRLGQNAADDVARNAIGNTLRLDTKPQPTSLRQGINESAVTKEVDVPTTEAQIPKPELVNAEKMSGNWFTNLFGNGGVGVSPMGSSKQISKGPLTTEQQLVKNSIRNDKDGIVQSIQAKSRAAYQNFVDRLSPLKTIGLRTYETAMDASRGNNIANTIVKDKFVTPEGVVVGEGLTNIFKKVARGQDRQFIDYLTLRHAATRMERGEEVFAKHLKEHGNPQLVRERVSAYEARHPGFKKIAQEWDQFNDNVLKTYGVDEGLISPELYKTLREKNPNYSPMRRQFSRSEKPGRKFLAKTTSSSFTGQKAPIKEVSPTGSVRNIVDPRKTTIESVGGWANAALRNRVMQSMVDTIKRQPEAFKGVAEIVQKPKDATDLRQVLMDGGHDDFVEILDADFKNLFQTARVDGDNIVRAMIKGEPVYLKVHDPEIVKTLIGMGPQASSLLLDTLTAFSNGIKRGATGVFAPVFAVKGATMDLVQSAIQAKNPPKQMAYTVYAILSGIGDRLNVPGLRNMARDFRRAGGEFSMALKGDRKLNRGISDMTRDPLLSPKGIGKGLSKVVSAPFKALEAIGDIAENAPRMAAAQIKLKGLGGMRTPDNVRQAMSAGRESTVNFSRKGALSNDLEALIPYNNAAIQGTVRVLKGLKNNPVRTVAAIATLAILPKMYEYYQFHDDPDYQKLPARERYRYLFIGKNEDGSFNKIPMEPAYNSFGEITIEAMRYFKDNDQEAFKGAADAIANAWLPPMITGGLQGVTQGTGPEGSLQGMANSTSLSPLSSVLSNRSFTGAPIVSQRLAGNSPSEQYDERTSEPAKWIGNKIGMSPLKVDYLIRSYGGDPARLILPLFSEVGAGTPRNTLLRNFIVDPVFTNTLSNDFYTMKEKISQAESNNRTNDTPFPKWYKEDIADYATSQKNSGINKKLSNLTADKRTIQADKTLSATEKAQKLRAVQAEMNEIYLEANMKMKQGGVP